MALFFLLIEFNFITTFIKPTYAAPGDGHMLLFFDGGTIPTGWSCVSCNPSDPFYQRFVRGSDTYGTTGGSVSHTHTYNGNISPSNSAGISEADGTGSVDANSHIHSLISSLDSASNLPEYRQLRIIRHDTNNEPSTIPEGSIAVFDSSTLPTNWSRYATQDGRYIRGENTVGTTGGSNTHSHDISLTIGTASGATYRSRGGGTQVQAAAVGHTHTATGVSSSVNIEPPYIEAYLGRATTNTAVPANIITMWDNEIPTGWQLRSDDGSPFHERFIKPANSFGTTGGSETHSHVNTPITTSTATPTTNARSGAGGAAANHTHTVTISDYSEENHVPPYIDVLFAKKQEPSSITQAGYRWFRNTNSADVGLALAGQDTPATSLGLPFRLRIILSISAEDLSLSGESLKLQFSEQVGTCDAGFSGEIYQDVSQSSGAIRYFNNSSVSNGDAAISNLNDPELSTGNEELQTYVDNNPFTNTQSIIADGDYGIWDFSLFDFSAAPNTTFCFRVVYSDGSLLDVYDTIPELTTDDGQGNMVLLYDGVTIPTDWSCVSCNPGEPFYQRFARGAPTYGQTGGSPTHSHTATGTVISTTDSGGNTGAGTEVSALGHSHTVTPILGEASNLPPYRQLKYIRYDLSGAPTTLPANVIALFDSTPPTGWTQYSAQNGLYIRGEATVGVTGGSLTHTHPVIGTVSTAIGGTTTDGGGGPAGAGATPDHTHDLVGNSPASNHEPPFRETILAQLDAPASLPAGIITFWDGSTPSSWEVLSENSGDFHHRFIKASTSYGASGGSGAHTHADHTVSTTTPSASIQARSSGGGASASHTHPVQITNVSSENHLPPYINTIIAKQPVPNTPPNTPSDLVQQRVTLGTSISIGGFTNETQVEFRATVSDPDDPDELELCVEVQPLSVSFSNTDSSCGSPASYSGTPLTATATVTGLANSEQYHWQARVKDGAGIYSSWVSFGGNLETERDFAVDTILPTGTVYDGLTPLIDIDYNDGSLDTLSANWDVADNESGVQNIDFSIGTSPGSTDTADWTSVGLDTDGTRTSLDLVTSVVYYANVRVTDNAGNSAVFSSDGQLVAPTLSFTTSTSGISFDNLNSSNNRTDTQTTILTTSTNARNGYVIRSYALDYLTSLAGDTVNMFDGGSYASPSEWQPGDTGFGYTSDDTSIQGVDIFNALSCLGGGSSPCFVPFSLSAPGDIVADNTDITSGTPIIDESFTITHRVTVDENQAAGSYQTVIIFSASAVY